MWIRAGKGRWNRLEQVLETVRKGEQTPAIGPDIHNFYIFLTEQQIENRAGSVLTSDAM